MSPTPRNCSNNSSGPSKPALLSPIPIASATPLTGRVAYILEHRQPAISHNGLLLGYEVVWLDVTRQTIAEKRLSTAAWKETLAVLTLGMAHDFTNIIAGIHSLSESFLSALEPAHPFHEGLSLIKKSSLQASQLVQRMISLHLGQTGERNYHNFNNITNDLVELVTKILPRRIQVKTELAAAPASRLPGRGGIPPGGHQSYVQRGGRHAPGRTADPAHIRGMRCAGVGKHERGRAPAALYLSDHPRHRRGIKQRHLPSIFDPFFTTKSKGSGLGLYNARIAIEKHQGAISVASTEGAGTSFQIWLPEADFSESRPRPGGSSPRRLPGAVSSCWASPAKCLIKPPNCSVPTITMSLSRRPPTAWANCFNPAITNSPAFSCWLNRMTPPCNSLPAEVRQQNKDVKLVLKPAGCNQDELDTQLLNRRRFASQPRLVRSGHVVESSSPFSTERLRIPCLRRPQQPESRTVPF